MSKKKRKRKELEAQLAQEDQEQEDAPIGAVQDKPAGSPGITPGQRLLSIVGFGLCGFLAAFLTGANLNPPAPPALTGLALASWEGAVLGSRMLNLGAGALAGLGGGLLGGALGFSIFLSPLAFVLNWAGGALGCWALFQVTGSFLGATVGWLLGSSLPLVIGKLSRG